MDSRVFAKSKTLRIQLAAKANDGGRGLKSLGTLALGHGIFIVINNYQVMSEGNWTLLEIKKVLLHS